MFALLLTLLNWVWDKVMTFGQMWTDDLSICKTLAAALDALF